MELNAADNDGRWIYYSLMYVPTLMIDGTENHYPISTTSLTNSVATHQQTESPISLDISASVSATSVDATVQVTSADVAVAGDHKIRVALLNTLYYGFMGDNGQFVWHYDMLDMAPDHEGLDFSIGANETVDVDVSFDWPVTVNGVQIADDNITVVAFVQNETTHEILQSQMYAVVPQDYLLTVTPLYETYVLPPSGGTITFDVQFTNNTATVRNGIYYFTSVVLPNGTTYGPLTTIPFNMTAYMDASVTGQTQYIPAYAPGGDYEFVTTVGLPGYPQYQVHDSFEFEKLGSGSADGFMFDRDDWTGSKFAVADQGSSPALPDGFTMTAAYPNPFNPSTTVELSLPSKAELTVTVHNITGQLVTTLHNGIAQAGQHYLTFDASDLSTGLYFIRAAIPGHAEQVQKVMLVK